MTAGRFNFKAGAARLDSPVSGRSPGAAALLIACFSLIFAVLIASTGCSSQARPPTTVAVTVSPQLPVTRQDPSLESGFGNYSVSGPGELFNERFDICENPAYLHVPSSILYFAHITDPHIVDFQSPDRMVKMLEPGPEDWPYRPQEGFAGANLRAMLATLQGFAGFHPFDAFIVTGDAADNNQYNEVRQFISLMDGQGSVPDTACFEYVGDNNICAPVPPGPGVGRTPWYFVIGNHDTIEQGRFTSVPRTLTPAEQAQALPASPENRQAISGYSPAFIACPLEMRDPATLVPLPTPAVPDRRKLTHNQVMAEFFTTSSTPVGHGFTSISIAGDTGYYTADIKPGVPIRLLAMDFSWSGVMDEGFIRRNDLEGFIKPQLEQAVADQVMVIVASHWPLDTISTQSEVGADELEAVLLGYPNVVLYLSGHSHQNRVIAHPSGLGDGYGFWEIETASTIVYPQQSRILEIAYWFNGVAQIWSTILDHDSTPGSPAWESRYRSIYEIQNGYGSDRNPGGLLDRNVILYVTVTPAVAAKMAALPVVPIESYNFYSSD